MVEDLDPPSFDFGREREQRTRERARERGREPGFLPDPDELLDFDEPEVEIEPEPAPPARSRLQRLLPEMSETTSRVMVAIPWIVVAVALVGIGGDAFAIGMVVLGVLGLREFFRMAASIHPIVLPGYATVAAMVLAAHFGDSFQILLVFALLFPVMFVFAAVRRSHELITTSIAFTVLGVAWMGLGFSHAVLLRDLPTHGAALLIDVLVATFLSDTAAYGAGRLFGTRRITPRISPNKTLEGLIGGFIGGTLGFWFAGLYQDWLPGIDALLMGMCIAVVAPLGDLFASMLKRDLGVKDTGRLFGPHGGLIDRLDAVLFTVVAGYYLSVAFVY
jgi:phosphatidate cytidylyltransferase